MVFCVLFYIIKNLILSCNFYISFYVNILVLYKTKLNIMKL